MTPAAPAHASDARRANTSPADGRWRDLLTGRWPWVLFTMGITVAAVWWVQRGSWTGDYFFDEQWRADMVRAARPWDRMLLHDTPTAIGWVLLTKALLWPFGHNPVAYRILTAAWYVVAAGVLSLLAMRVAERSSARVAEAEPAPNTWLPHRLLPASAAALLGFSPAISHWYHYFNNYTWEVLYVAVLVLALEELGRTRGAPIVSIALLALAPLFLVGGLLAVPGAALCLLVWLRATSAGRPRRRATMQLAVGAAFGSMAMALVWVCLYEPIGSKRSIRTYWIGEGASLGGSESVGSLLGRTATQIAQGAAGQGLEWTGGWTWAIARVVVVVAAVVGVVYVARRWIWLVLVPVTAYALAVAASATVHWPMTIERVNMGFALLAFLTITLGAVHIVEWLCRGAASLTIVSLVLVGVLLWPYPWAFGDLTFSRPARADMQVIADSPGRRNVVVIYHPLLHWYAHDLLLNEAHGDRTFDLLWQTDPDSDVLHRDLDGVLAGQSLRRGDMVWCVMSHFSGAANHDACRFSAPAAARVVEHGGTHLIVLGYLVE